MENILTFYIINQYTHISIISVRRPFGLRGLPDRVHLHRNQGPPDPLLLACLTWSLLCP